MRRLRWCLRGPIGGSRSHPGAHLYPVRYAYTYYMPRYAHAAPGFWAARWVAARPRDTVCGGPVASRAMRYASSRSAAGCASSSLRRRRSPSPLPELSRNTNRASAAAVATCAFGHAPAGVTGFGRFLPPCEGMRRPGRWTVQVSYPPSGAHACDWRTARWRVDAVSCCRTAPPCSTSTDAAAAWVSHHEILISCLAAVAHAIIPPMLARFAAARAALGRRRRRVRHPTRIGGRPIAYMRAQNYPRREFLPCNPRRAR